SLCPDHRVPGNPQPLRQRIRRLEANAMDIEGQAIGILPHVCNGLIAVGLVNPDSTRGPNAVRMQEDHDLSDHFLLSPCCNDPLSAFGTNAVEVRQPFGGLLNDVKYLRAKRLDEFVGEVGANAFDHARAEILFNAFEGTGWDDS